jgi:hypothetical protein
MVDELISRRESAARVTVEVQVTARRILFPDGVVEGKASEDQVHLKDLGCIVVSLLSIVCISVAYIQYFLLSSSRYSVRSSCCVILEFVPGTLSALPSLQKRLCRGTWISSLSAIFLSMSACCSCLHCSNNSGSMVAFWV